MIGEKKERESLRLVSDSPERGAEAAPKEPGTTDPPRFLEATLIDGLRGRLREAELHLDSLLCGEWGALGEEQKRALQAAREAASVVDELLALLGCSGEESEGREGTFELRFLLWDVADDLSCLARSRRVSLSVRPGPCIAFPLPWRSGLSVLLRLLLHEHIHGAGRGGWVDVEVDPDGEEVLLRIRHGGPGPLSLCHPGRLARFITERFLFGHRGKVEVKGREWVLCFPRSDPSSLPVRGTSSSI